MEKLKEALNNFKGKKIIVLGDVMLDKFCWGKIERLNPEQPAAPNVYIENETYTLGGAANTANNVVPLGGECKLYGNVGEDIYGEKIKELCEDKKISLSCFNNKNPTIVKQRIMAHGQQVARLNYGEIKRQDMDDKIREEIINKLEKNIEEADFIIFSDYNKKFFNEKISQNIIKLANFYNLPTIVDSKPANVKFFRDCTFIRPNKIEASEMTWITYSNGIGTLEKIGEKLSEIVNCPYAIITCGEDGTFSYDRKNEKSLMIGTKARKIADKAGAGDTFVAAFALSSSCGLDIFDASRLANYAAGNVVEKIGVATTNIEEIKKRIDEDKI